MGVNSLEEFMRNSGVGTNGKAKALPKEPEEEGDWQLELLPEYKAFAHSPRDRPLVCLHVIFNSEGRKKYGKSKIQLQYHEMCSDDPMTDGLAADGRSFSVVFAGNKTLRLTVRGRNLGIGFGYTTFHRMPSIMAIDKDRDFEGAIPDGEAVITSIDIEEIKEPKD